MARAAQQANASAMFFTTEIDVDNDADAMNAIAEVGQTNSTKGWWD